MPRIKVRPTRTTQAPLRPAGITTSPDAFAAKGDPWMTERERREDFAHVSPLPRKRAKPKPEFREAARAYERGEGSETARAQLANLQGVLAAMGGTRTVAPMSWDNMHKRFVPA